MTTRVRTRLIRGRWPLNTEAFTPFHLFTNAVTIARKLVQETPETDISTAPVAGVEGRLLCSRVDPDTDSQFKDLGAVEHYFTKFEHLMKS